MASLSAKPSSSAKVQIVTHDVLSDDFPSPKKAGIMMGAGVGGGYGSSVGSAFSSSSSATATDAAASYRINTLLRGGGGGLPSDAGAPIVTVAMNVPSIYQQEFLARQQQQQEQRHNSPARTSSPLTTALAPTSMTAAGRGYSPEAAASSLSVFGGGGGGDGGGDNQRSTSPTTAALVASTNALLGLSTEVNTNKLVTTLQHITAALQAQAKKHNASVGQMLMMAREHQERFTALHSDIEAQREQNGDRDRRWRAIILPKEELLAAGDGNHNNTTNTTNNATTTATNNRGFSPTVSSPSSSPAAAAVPTALVNLEDRFLKREEFFSHDATLSAITQSIQTLKTESTEHHSATQAICERIDALVREAEEKERRARAAEGTEQQRRAKEEEASLLTAFAKELMFSWKQAAYSSASNSSSSGGGSSSSSSSPPPPPSLLSTIVASSLQNALVSSAYSETDAIQTSIRNHVAKHLFHMEQPPPTSTSSSSTFNVGTHLLAPVKAEMNSLRSALDALAREVGEQKKVVLVTAKRLNERHDKEEGGGEGERHTTKTAASNSSPSQQQRQIVLGDVLAGKTDSLNTTTTNIAPNIEAVVKALVRRELEAAFKGKDAATSDHTVVDGGSTISISSLISECVRKEVSSAMKVIKEELRGEVNGLRQRVPNASEEKRLQGEGHQEQGYGGDKKGGANRETSNTADNKPPASSSDAAAVTSASPAAPPPAKPSSSRPTSARASTQRPPSPSSPLRQRRLSSSSFAAESASQQQQQQQELQGIAQATNSNSNNNNAFHTPLFRDMEQLWGAVKDSQLNASAKQKETDKRLFLIENTIAEISSRNAFLTQQVQSKKMGSSSSSSAPSTAKHTTNNNGEGAGGDGFSESQLFVTKGTLHQHSNQLSGSILSQCEELFVTKDALKTILASTDAKISRLGEQVKELQLYTRAGMQLHRDKALLSSSAAKAANDNDKQKGQSSSADAGGSVDEIKATTTTANAVDGLSLTGRDAHQQATAPPSPNQMRPSPLPPPPPPPALLEVGGGEASAAEGQLLLAGVAKPSDTFVSDGAHFGGMMMGSSEDDDPSTIPVSRKELDDLRVLVEVRLASIIDNYTYTTQPRHNGEGDGGEDEKGDCANGGAGQYANRNKNNKATRSDRTTVPPAGGGRDAGRKTTPPRTAHPPHLSSALSSQHSTARNSSSTAGASPPLLTASPYTRRNVGGGAVNVSAAPSPQSVQGRVPSASSASLSPRGHHHPQQQQLRSPLEEQHSTATAVAFVANTNNDRTMPPPARPSTSPASSLPHHQPRNAFGSRLLANSSATTTIATSPSSSSSSTAAVTQAGANTNATAMGLVPLGQMLPRKPLSAAAVDDVDDAVRTGLMEASFLRSSIVRSGDAVAVNTSYTNRSSGEYDGVGRIAAQQQRNSNAHSIANSLYPKALAIAEQQRQQQQHGRHKEDERHQTVRLRLSSASASPPRNEMRPIAPEHRRMGD